MMSMLNCTVVISEILTLSLYAYRCYGVDFFLWEARGSVDFLKLIASPSCQWLKDGKEVEDVLWMHLYSPVLQLFIYFICLWRNNVARRSVAQACLTFCDPMDARPPCPSLSPGVCSDSCLLSQWCHPAILSSVVPFSSHLQSFPASGSFPVSHFFPSGSPSMGASASVSVLPVNIQDWFPLGLTGLISL